MNMLRELMDRMFKITETYEMNEMSKDGALDQIDPYVSHLLWYLANPNEQKRQQKALSSMAGFLKIIAREVNDITGRPEARVYKVETGLRKEVKAAERTFNGKYVYETDYHDKSGIDAFMQRVEDSPITLKTLGIAVSFIKGKVQLTVNPSLIGQ